MPRAAWLRAVLTGAADARQRCALPWVHGLQVGGSGCACVSQRAQGRRALTALGGAHVHAHAPQAPRLPSPAEFRFGSGRTPDGAPCAGAASPAGSPSARLAHTPRTRSEPRSSTAGAACA